MEVQLNTGTMVDGGMEFPLKEEGNCSFGWQDRSHIFSINWYSSYYLLLPQTLYFMDIILFSPHDQNGKLFISLTTEL